MELVELRRVLRLDAAARLGAYAGDVLVLRQVPAAKALCAAFEGIKRRFTASQGAGRAPISFDCDAGETSFSDREAFCQAFETDEGVRALFLQILTDAGAGGSGHQQQQQQQPGDDLDVTCWDRPRLRVQQSGGGVDDVSNTDQFGEGKFSSTLPAHRDTWASNIYQQLNWWLPLSQIDAGRTLCFYPTYFDSAVANTSGEWSFSDLKQSRRDGRPYPQMPALLDPCQADAKADSGEDSTSGAATASDSRAAGAAVSAEGLRSAARALVVDPGDVVIFSGQHLHASVVNVTGRTRYVVVSFLLSLSPSLSPRYSL